MARLDLPLWRSLLFCPANSERFITKAHLRGADGIILDLEDSVPLDEKGRARGAVAAAARHIRTNGTDVLVRINRELDLTVADIQACVGADVAALVLPKIKGPEHVHLIAEIVATCETKAGLTSGHTKFFVLVETAAALTSINAIAAADPRVVALAVGGEDLATDLEAEPTVDTLYVAKMLGIHAARAAGILPLGVLGSVANVADEDAYRSMVARSRALGFAGASCIHPTQVAILNATFVPQASEVARSRRIVDAFEAAQLRGDGATLFEGSMIDMPVAIRARRLLERAASSTASQN